MSGAAARCSCIGKVTPGHRMVVSYPVNLFSLDLRAKKHLMLAGGIGITPFMAQTAQLAATGGNFELHYACRTASLVTYADVLHERYGQPHPPLSRRPRRVDPARPPAHLAAARHAPLYLRPARHDRMGARHAPRPLGWPDETVHFEHFAAPEPGLPFDVTLALSGKTIRVGEQQSLLEAIEAAGVDPPYLCRGGVCGQCETNVISCDGNSCTTTTGSPRRSIARARRSCPACRASRAARSCWNGKENHSMGINFRTRSFRDDFTFRNTPEHIRRFPFPFHEDSYMYAVNIEPHVAGPVGSVLERPIDVDEHYVSEMHDRELVLAEDPLRCQSLPHMTLAGWDLLELLMTAQAEGYPEHFTLTRDGDNWHWINRPLGIDQKFVFGDLSTLPYGPMEYISRQSQGDFCLLDQRDGNLWMDAGIVTTQADWSLDFDIGMNFFEWHAPVPLAHEKGIFIRALKFLTNIQQGKPARRLNWTMTINPRLDTSPENYHKWGPDRDDRDAGERRREGASARRAAELLAPAALERAGLPDPLLSDQDGRARHLAEMGAAAAPRAARPAGRLASYKGLTRYRPTVVEWLAKYDDGSPTSPGFGPE